ncbi:MAG TPA: hypothetical protein VFU01_17810 [Gemmatimonadaceae bacterium]|nr:hypothetical protein [Gemmatimonadaceae bacterium]
MASLPPFAVPPNRFPFRALAMRAGRAPLGGEREVAIATFMVARLSRDAVGEHALTIAQRAERATAAKSWLNSLAVPAQARQALLHAIDATALDATAIAAALTDVAKALAPWLDAASVAELRAITTAPFVNS